MIMLNSFIFMKDCISQHFYSFTYFLILEAFLHVINIRFFLLYCLKWQIQYNYNVENPLLSKAYDLDFKKALKTFRFAICIAAYFHVCCYTEHTFLGTV